MLIKSTKLTKTCLLKNAENSKATQIDKLTGSF